MFENLLVSIIKELIVLKLKYFRFSKVVQGSICERDNFSNGADLKHPILS